MKRTELEQAIEEIITEILSESDVTDINNAIKNKKINPKEVEDAAKQAQQGKSNALAIMMATAGALKEEEDDDDSSTEKEPSKAELRKNAGVAKVKDELAKVTKKMKDLAKEYSKAEGDKKDKIKNQLKGLTAEKKDLEKRLDKFL